MRHAQLRWPVSKDLHELKGCRVVSGIRRAKYLLFETGAGTLLMHLGMSGALRVAEPDLEWRKHDHVAFALDSGQHLRLHDPRRFGAVLLLHQDWREHPLLANLGPEPLGMEFTAEYLSARCRGREAPIKAVIMDSRVVVGVGNIYASEALYRAGIHPNRAAGKVSRPRLVKLVKAIRDVLTASIEMGGTTLRDFLNENGEPGYFAQTLQVYDREGEPCRACGKLVRRTVMSNRSTFFCTHCQK